MKPLIKYRGGKSKEIPLFQKYIPREYDRYVEPFLGGGAVYFYLEPNKGAIVNDINGKLMHFYTDVRDNFESLENELLALERLYNLNQAEYYAQKKERPSERAENKNEALYYMIRNMYNAKIPSEFLNGTIYYFINKLSYAGMIRYNAKGEYNVPFGRYKNFSVSGITAQHRQLLSSTEIFCGDYEKIFDKTTDKDFVFLDPPYDCIFNDYGNIEMTAGFNESEHRRLADNFKNLCCKTLMIIGKTDLTEELYRNYIVDEYGKSYAVNIRNRFKSTAKHIVVKNF